MSRGPTTRFKVEVLDGERTSRREDVVVTEEPLELRLEWPGRPAEPLVVTMRTPGSDFELAAAPALARDSAFFAFSLPAERSAADFASACF